MASSRTTQRPPSAKETKRSHDGLTDQGLQSLITWLEDSWEGIPHPQGQAEEQAALIAWIEELILACSEAEKVEAHAPGTVYERTGDIRYADLVAQPWCVQDHLFCQLLIPWLWASGYNGSSKGKALNNQGVRVGYGGQSLMNMLREAEKAVPRLRFRRPELWCRPAAHTPIIDRTGNPFEHMLPLPLETLYGRADDMRALKQRLGVAASGNEEALRTQVLTAIGGIGGMGKTSLAVHLGRDPEVLRAFPGGVLWWSLGEAVQISTELACMGKAIGCAGLDREDRLRLIKQAIARHLGDRRVLLVLDDVWNVEDATHARQSLGAHGVLLLTTRLPRIADELTGTQDAIYMLPPLAQEDALRMLAALSGPVVDEEPDACRRLLEGVGHLPLAIRVSGPMLRRQHRVGCGVAELIRSLTQGDALWDAKAPPEYAQRDQVERLTVAAVLRRSTDMLSPKVRRCFATLAGFPPKPARITFADLDERWNVDSPASIVAELLDHGLLESPGPGLYQVHPVIRLLAREITAQAAGSSS